MPTLNQYSPDSDKEGFYIRANVGGDLPITLQVSLIASRIFKAVGYEDGDTVPTELVWAMYSFDMVYTLTSIDLDSEPTDPESAKILEDLDLESKLTDEERAELISYLEAYSGPDVDRIEELREELLEDISEDELDAVARRTGTWFEDRHQLPETPDEVATQVQRWTERDRSDLIKKALLLQEDFVTWSVRTFSAHPHLTGLCKIENEEIVYKLDPPGSEENVTIADCRGHNRTVSDGRTSPSEYDYRITRTKFDGTDEVAHVRGEAIVKYESFNGDRGSVTILKYDLDKLLPPHQSYFGDSDSKGYTASLLQEQFLSQSISEIKQSVDDWRDPPEQTEDAEEIKQTEGTVKISDTVKQAIKKTSGASLHTVDGISGNDNPKIQINENMLIVVSNIQAEVGTPVVIREHGEYKDNMQVENVVRADKIPEDNAEEWINSRI